MPDSFLLPPATVSQMLLLAELLRKKKEGNQVFPGGVFRKGITASEDPMPFQRAMFESRNPNTEIR
jgi:hypothetical protein